MDKEISIHFQINTLLLRLYSSTSKKDRQNTFNQMVCLTKEICDIDQAELNAILKEIKIKYELD